MRIWFNQGFSLAPIAQAMMAADPALEVCISVGQGSPIYGGPSQTWREPGLSGDAYCDWVRQTICEQQIDVFVPTRHRWQLAGVKLPCRVESAASPAVLEILDDKFAFAEALADQDCHLPTALAKSSSALRELLSHFRQSRPGAIPCVKPQIGVNGHGFWKLTEGKPTAHLMDPDARNIQQGLYLAALEAQEAERPIAPVVLMEYLPGPEVSIDVLAHHGEALRLLARTKLGNRQQITSDHPLLPTAASLVTRFALHGMVNVQFRRASDGTWKVLEINPRAAGGAVYADQFGGCMVGDWGGLLTGRLTPTEVDRTPLNVEFAFTRALSEVKAPVSEGATA